MKRRVAPVAGRRFRQRQRPIGRRPFGEQIDRRARRRGDVDDDARVRLARLAMHGENGETVAGAERHAARHANLRLLDRRFLGAVAVERKRQIGLDRHAQSSADGVTELEVQRRSACAASCGATCNGRMT